MKKLQTLRRLAAVTATLSLLGAPAFAVNDPVGMSTGPTTNSPNSVNPLSTTPQTVTGTVRAVDASRRQIVIQSAGGVTSSYTLGDGSLVDSQGARRTISNVSTGDVVTITLAADGTTVDSIHIQ